MIIESASKQFRHFSSDSSDPIGTTKRDADSAGHVTLSSERAIGSTVRVPASTDCRHFKIRPSEADTSTNWRMMKPTQPTHHRYKDAIGSPDHNEKRVLINISETGQRTSPRITSNSLEQIEQYLYKKDASIVSEDSGLSIPSSSGTDEGEVFTQDAPANASRKLGKHVSFSEVIEEGEAAEIEHAVLPPLALIPEHQDVEVTVTWVNSPSDFWCHLRGPDNDRCLDDLLHFTR